MEHVKQGYYCKNCGIAANSWNDSTCEGKLREPPFSFTFAKAPNKGSKFCSSGHKMDKIRDLVDLDNVECRAGTAGFGALLITASSGLMDTYRCSHCHEVFEAKCIHALC